MANGRDVEGHAIPSGLGDHPRERRTGSSWRGPTVPVKPTRGLRRPSRRRFEATPLVVDGTMYVGTPLGRVIALDPATGTRALGLRSRRSRAT